MSWFNSWSITSYFNFFLPGSKFKYTIFIIFLKKNGDNNYFVETFKIFTNFSKLLPVKLDKTRHLKKHSKNVLLKKVEFDILNLHTRPRPNNWPHKETCAWQFGLCLTRAVGPWEERGVAEVVLQWQVCQAVHAVVGREGEQKRMAGSKHCHEPRRASIRSAGASVSIDGCRVGQFHSHCILKTSMIQRKCQQEGAFKSQMWDAECTVPCHWWCCMWWRRKPTVQPWCRWCYLPSPPEKQPECFL